MGTAGGSHLLGFVHINQKWTFGWQGAHDPLVEFDQFLGNLGVLIDRLALPIGAATAGCAVSAAMATSAFAHTHFAGKAAFRHGAVGHDDVVD